MELTDRKARVLQYLCQELPLKWQDRDCAANLAGAAAKISLASASIDRNAGYVLKAIGQLDVEDMERIPSYRVRDAAYACGTALAYLELTAALQGWGPHDILHLAESAYESAHGPTGFEKPAREHGMDEVAFRHATSAERESWLRVLAPYKKQEPADAANTDEPTG